MRKIFSVIVLLFSLIGTIDTYAEPMNHYDSVRPEVQCMAQIIYKEARGEPYAGKLAVATVLINRTEDSRFPHTICQVAHQGTHNTCQFQSNCQSNSGIRNPNKAQWEDAVDIANHVIYFGERSDIILKHRAILFHAKYVHPFWANTKHKVVVIGGHTFYGEYHPEKYDLVAQL